MALRLLQPSIIIHSATNSINLTAKLRPYPSHPLPNSPHCQAFATKMSSAADITSSPSKIIDSHLHVWASPQEAAEKYPYFPGQEPTLPGHAEFLLECMEEAGVDGALIVQPINHKFDHSYVTSILKKYPSKFAGCCLANPADNGNGIEQLEELVSKDGYCAVRFNPYLWPSGQKMTNEIGKALFSKAGELGVPVGFMCMKGLNLHISEIEELCTEYPKTPVLIDHMGFCKAPTISREAFPYQDLSSPFSQIISSFGANRIMWGSDFPFVVSECGYKEAKEAISLIAKQANMTASELNWIKGGTIMKLFPGQWISS